MKKSLFWILIFLIPAAIVYIFASNQIPRLENNQKTILEKMGDECAGIAENSVANMTAIVEFQKLEIQGRKFNVMRRCMADHGCFENPKWTAYANPIALSDSVKNRISEDEAIENLRRSHMMIFKVDSNHPNYWKLRP